MAEQVKKRSEVRAEDTWKLEDYFETDEAFKEACASLKEQISGYKKYCGHLADSADVLYECLQFDDELCLLFERVYHYAFQKQDQDTAEGKYQEFYGKAYDLYTEMAAESSYIAVEITAIGSEKLARMMEEKPQLKLYERSFEQILRKEPYMRSDVEERLLAKASAVTGAADDIFKMFNNADLKFAPAVDSQGKEHTVTHGTFVHLLESKDRVLRKSAFESMYSTYRSFQNTLAAMYQANLKEHSFYARIRGYESPWHYSLHNNAIPVEVFEQLIAAVRESFPAMYRYVGLRKKMLGVDDLSLYDVYVSVAQIPEKKYTFEEAKAIVYEALKPMGQEYLDVLKEGFENRWIDVYENQGKRSGAYSAGAYGTHPYVLLNYNGTLDNMFTLAHEMGHAMHSYYSNSTQPYIYSQYKIFVAEVASTCNEILLMEYLLKNTTDKKERAYLLNHYLDSFKGTVYRQTQFAEFEMRTNAMVEAGESLTAENLSSLYLELNQKYYGSDMISDKEISYEWARIPHFYYNFYVYQYATGFSSAVAIAHSILKEGAPAVERYKKFLSGGCSDSPVELLKIAGVNLETPAPIQEALDVFGSIIDEMETLV